MNNLKKKTVKGVSWSVIDNIANSGITFLVGVILARILSPEEFGLLGMIAIFIAMSNSIIESGFSSALIRKVGAKPVDYNTVFYFNIFLGIILYIILFFCAPSISNFFDEPLLVSITRVMGFILIINAFGIVQRTLLVKEVDFKMLTKISFIASILSGFVGVGMALRGFGVWSLVGQQMSRQLFNSIFLWVFNTWRPAMEFSKQSFDELFGFGSKLLISGLIDTIYKNIYYLVIGKLYSSSLLGQYTRADQFNSIFSSNLTSVVQRVSYPVLCSIQDDEEKLRQVYRRVIKTTMLITFSCMLGMAAVAKPLILLLIGEKWLPSVVFLQIICFSGMLYPLHAINLNMLEVKGRSDLFLKLEIMKKIIGIFPIILGIFCGIEFMLLGGVLMSFLAYFLNSYYSAELISYSTWQQIKDILPSFLVSLFVATIMWSISYLGFSVWITLPLQCFIGVILAVIIYEFMKLPEYLELKEIVLSTIKRK
ncbi:MAG TPA: lipopolysaccharide biosynthesis protein [Flavobacterium sp.]|uniref:lipopolysaccharide biosynthesis protein n=1 Tax=Flavobacterium sp. TaxID=239 RepID=UPI002DBD698B|nr:lipopolysaccharide biosynthesis protein [Flavobacterium sp.]HEU4788670.1 lipopolysaccharide biosynthesis protein [Flavobacterium sp.]